MKKSKGFTLIELLAVIVILVIIALIATPTILGVIEKAKKGSYEQSANGYIDAVEKQMAINELDSSKDPIADGTYTVKQLTNLGVSVKGESPENESWVKIENNQVADYSLKIGDYVVNYDKDTNAPVATKNGTLNDIGSGPTKVNATETDTHKGIVYLDPTDLTKYCNSTNSVSTTGTKTGCMKWYIYAEDDNSYTMILDHNTTAEVAWVLEDDYISAGGTNWELCDDDGICEYGNNEKGPITAQKQLTNDTSSWNSSIKETARLITADEIATITGNTSFDETTSTNGFVLGTDEPDVDEEYKYLGTYAWLYDYTSDCTSYGCSIEDSSVLGYWTSTPVAEEYPYACWCVVFYGYLRGSLVSYDDDGIRPVITISKSIIS